MPRFDEAITHAASLAIGCVWVASGGGGEAVYAASIGAVGLIAIAKAVFGKVAVESNDVLTRVRKKVRHSVEVQLPTFRDQLDLAEADRCLAEDLPRCFLDRAALVEAAVDIAGFPTKATELVMAALAKSRPSIFGPEGSVTARDYTHLVISTALWSAIDNREYFERLQARLTLKQMQTLGIIVEQAGKVLERTGQIETDLGTIKKTVDSIDASLSTVLTRLEAKSSTGQSDRSVYHKSLSKCPAITDLQGAIHSVLENHRDGSESTVTSKALLTSLKFSFPTPVKDALAAQQKCILYGGFDPALSLDFSPLEFVATGLAFERDLARILASGIINSGERFSSHTIVSRPGQGKSLALAQIVSRLCNVPGFVTFWSFDASAPFACHDGRSIVEALFSIFRKINLAPKRTIFVFDDLPKRLHAGDLHRFYSSTRAFAYSEQIDVSFVFSTSDPAITLTTSEEKVMPLTLTMDDETRLYKELTEIEPRIVNKRFDTIEELMEKHPKARDYRDDVRSSIDFMIEHSEPIQAFRANWFSDISLEPEAARDAIAFFAVSQLFDLPVPNQLALEAIASHGQMPLRKESDLLRVSSRICRVEDDWPGFGLASGYYAQSVLRHIGRLTRPFIETTLTKIVSTSIDHARLDLGTWTDNESEYIRHIFQRLAKRNLYILPEVPDKVSIADEIFIKFGGSILEILGTVNDGGQYARWAGTFSSLGLFQAESNFDENSTSVPVVVYKLCKNALSLLGANIMENPREFTSLMRASRKLLRQFRHVPRVVEMLQPLVDDTKFQALVISETEKSEFDVERRSNELLLAYANFLLLIPIGSIKFRKRRVYKLYDKMETEFLRRGLRFDAGNALTRSDAILIADQNDYRSIRMCAQLLDDARNSVRRQARVQATWSANVTGHINTFEAKFGPIDNYVRH